MLNPLAFVSSSQRINHAPSTQATLQEIHSFTPSLVNQVALGYTRWYLSQIPVDIGFNTSQKLGLQGSNTSYEGSGLATLVRCAARVPSVVLINPSTIVRRVIEASGLAGILHMQP